MKPLLILLLAIATAHASDRFDAYARAAAYRKAMAEDLARAGEWRTVDGVTSWTLDKDWVEFTGIVLANHQTGIRIKGWYGPPHPSEGGFEGEFFVANFPGKVAENEYVGSGRSGRRFLAKPAGLYTYPTVLRSDRTIRQLDYGVPAAPPKPRELTAAEKEAAAIAKTKADAETAARVLAWQQAQAEKGSPSAQYDLAQRYLAGDGVEKNETTARTLLEKSAAQDHTPAKLALKKFGASQ